MKPKPWSIHILCQMLDLLTAWRNHFSRVSGNSRPIYRSRLVRNIAVGTNRGSLRLKLESFQQLLNAFYFGCRTAHSIRVYKAMTVPGINQRSEGLYHLPLLFCQPSPQTNVVGIKRPLCWRKKIQHQDYVIESQFSWCICLLTPCTPAMHFGERERHRPNFLSGQLLSIAACRANPVEQTW